MLGLELIHAGNRGARTDDVAYKQQIIPGSWNLKENVTLVEY